MAYAVRHPAGYLMVKRYDPAYRRVVAGKWVLYDPAGTCLGHAAFFDQPTAAPPVAWADQKITDRRFLASVGY